LDIAVQIGADVPFFILPAAQALGRGKGEILTPLKLRRKRWYILVIPRLKDSTRRMYQDPRLRLTKRPQSAKIILRALEGGNITSLNKYSYNSFEPVVQKRYKQISRVKKALKSLGVQATLMSGSGPCIFGICATRREAIKIREELRIREKDWQVIVAKTFR
jgi:4-diphosphocytidyl-2-C-methyl-D-erythritol kinase